MRTVKWEVMFERFQKRYVHAKTQQEASKLAAEMLPGAKVKYIRRCGRK